MNMAYPTRWYSSAMQGAPSLTGQAGAGITFFDAVLNNGFGQLTLTSLVVASNVATATISGGHAYKQWQVIQIAGATPSGLNGEKRILSVTGTTFTFATSGISDQTATGTITAKVPGAGWTKPLSGTNKAAYLMDTVQGTGGYLRVDDTGTTDMRVTGNMAMSDIDTGTDTFPSSAQISGGGYFRKSATSDATARPWIMVADDRFFYLSVDTNGSGTATKAYAFGDFVSLAGASGPWDCVVACGAVATGSPALGRLVGDTSTPKSYIPRLYDGTPGSVIAPLYGVGQYSGDGNINDEYPSQVTGGILAVDFAFILQGAYNSTVGIPRGLMPGYITFFNDCISAFTWATPVLLSGRSEYIMPIFTGDSTGDVFGVSLGAWR